MGAIAVPINVLHEGRDLEFLLANCGAVGIITIAPYYPRIKEVQERLLRVKWIVAVRGNAPQPANTYSWEDLTKETLPNRMDSFAEPDQTALLSYTAGTSGSPRGAMLSHVNLLANCRQFTAMQQVEFGAGSLEKVLLPVSLFNLYALNIGLNHTFMIGGTVVMMERFDTARALELIQKHGCTIIHGTPSIFRDLINSPDFSQADLTSLRYAFSYGAPLPDSVAQAFLKRTRIPIMECYSIAEGGVIASSGAAPQVRTGTVGQAVPGVKIRLIDDNEQDQPPGTIGEIMVSGENLMQDYFNLRKFEAAQEEELETGETNKLFAPLWLRTGDVGWIDTDFNLYVFDRREDMMFIEGEIIFPREIEEALCTHPAVSEAAAVGVRQSGTEPHFEAVIVLDKYQRNIKEKELMEYIKGILPAKHLPHRIYFADYLPRLVNGRIMRRAIKLGGQPVFR